MSWINILRSNLFFEFMKSTRRYSSWDGWQRNNVQDCHTTDVSVTTECVFGCRQESSLLKVSEGLSFRLRLVNVCV